MNHRRKVKSQHHRQQMKEGTMVAVASKKKTQDAGLTDGDNARTTPIQENVESSNAAVVTHEACTEVTRKSIELERHGDLQRANGQLDAAIAAYERAIKLELNFYGPNNATIAYRKRKIACIRLFLYIIGGEGRYDEKSGVMNKYGSSSSMQMFWHPDHGSCLRPAGRRACIRLRWRGFRSGRPPGWHCGWPSREPGSWGVTSGIRTTMGFPT